MQRGERRGGEREEVRKEGNDGHERTAHLQNMFIHMHLSLSTTESVFSKTRAQPEPDGCLKPQLHNSVFTQDNV